MILLPRAPQQRLVRRVLDQRMLERVHSLRGHTALRHQFGLDQLRQCPLQRRGVEWRHGLHQVIGEGAPDNRAQLRHAVSPLPGDPTAPSAHRAG